MSVKALRNQLLAAIAMVLVAAIALGSSTFAWFASNNTVRAEGMQVQAQTETGIIISTTPNGAANTWSTLATAVSPSAKLLPTSTEPAHTVWYHAISNLYDDALASQAADKYTNLNTAGLELSNSTANNAVGYVDTHTGESFTGYDAGDSIYYLLHHFYIKSSSVAISGQDLLLHKIEVSGNSTSPNLDKSLRILVALGDKQYIYAPFDGATLTYRVGGANNTAITVKSAANQVAINDKLVEAGTIPANTTETPLDVSVYAYFEGEDANCKSSNITDTLDNITINLQFGLNTYTAPTNP